MSSTPASVYAEKFYESKDHFFRFRRHLTAYVRALSADPRLPSTGTALTHKAIHQGLQKHLLRFPSDMFHKGTRELVATLMYFWRIGNSDAGDPPFEPVEEPECMHEDIEYFLGDGVFPLQLDPVSPSTADNLVRFTPRSTLDSFLPHSLVTPNSSTIADSDHDQSVYLRASTGPPELEPQDNYEQNAMHQSEFTAHRNVPKTPPPHTPLQSSDLPVLQTHFRQDSHSVKDEPITSVQELDKDSSVEEDATTLPRPSKASQAPSHLKRPLNKKKRKAVESSSSENSDGDSPQRPHTPPSPHTLVLWKQIELQRTCKYARMQPEAPIISCFRKEGFSYEESKALRDARWNSIVLQAAVAHPRKKVNPETDVPTSVKPGPLPAYLFTTPSPIYQNPNPSFTEGNPSADKLSNVPPIDTLDGMKVDPTGGDNQAKSTSPSACAELQSQLKGSSTLGRKRNPPRAAQSIYQYARPTVRFDKSTHRDKPTRSLQKKPENSSQPPPKKPRSFEEHPDSPTSPSRSCVSEKITPDPSFVNGSENSQPGPAHQGALSLDSVPKPTSASILQNSLCCFLCNNPSKQRGPTTCLFTAWGKHCENCAVAGKAKCTYAQNANEFMDSARHSSALHETHPDALRSLIDRVNHSFALAEMMYKIAATQHSVALAEYTRLMNTARLIGRLPPMHSKGPQPIDRSYLNAFANVSAEDLKAAREFLAAHLDTA